MKKALLFIFAAFFVMPAGTAAQIPPPPIPVPVTETEIRDDSIKLRSTELERIKREAYKIRSDSSSVKQNYKFSIIKKDFESIQKLQDKVIRAYTGGERIDYKSISRSAAEMNKDAVRLSENLFESNGTEANVKERESETNLSVRELIIKLDDEIMQFVSNPMFNNNNVIESVDAAKAQKILESIIYLSRSLAIVADRDKTK